MRFLFDLWLNLKKCKEIFFILVSHYFRIKKFSLTRSIFMYDFHYTIVRNEQICEIPKLNARNFVDVHLTMEIDDQSLSLN